MATTAFVMPKLAMGMNEGTVQEWLVSDGDFVERGQAIASVETEKVAEDKCAYFHKKTERKLLDPL